MTSPSSVLPAHTARRLWSIDGNTQRLDGGAMFGNAPKAVWQKWIAPDEQNRIPLACRTMLVRETAEDRDPRWLLFETGIGAFFEPKLKRRFGVVEEQHVLLDNLAKVGVRPGAISAVVLSHLHFDHAGGLLTAFDENEELELLFDKATYVVSQAAWDRAQKPHPRDRASYIPRLQTLLSNCDRLEIIDGDTSPTLGSQYKLHYSEGHTPGLMLVELPSADGPIVFGGDLIPGAPWIHAPITMGYDRYPERLIDEKTALLEDLVNRNGRVFFTHDPTIAMARIVKDDRGRFAAGESWTTVREHDL